MENGASMRLVEDDAGRPPLSDDELMFLSKAGESEAFERLVRRHQRTVLGFATRFLDDEAAARDVAQDVFLALWSNLPGYEPRGKFVPYLISLARNRCLYAARQRASAARKHRMIRQEPPPRRNGDEPLDSLLEMEKTARVHRELAGLPDRMKEVLILRFTAGMPIAEIAKITGHPVGTVKSHLSRGLARLHARCGKETR